MDIVLMTDELALAAVIVVTLLIDFTAGNKKFTGYFFTLAVTALLVFVIINKKGGSMLEGVYIYDGVARFAKIIFLSGAALTGMFSINNLKLSEKYHGAYYALLGSSTLGMMFLASSKELITLYVGLELATVPLYALTAIYKKDVLSMEAGIKYLILGAFSSGILLYGLSLVYGVTGATSLDKIMAFTSAGGAGPVFVIAIIMVILGVGFKLSMVPMHVWTPDVYHGAPTPVTAFISVASKAAGFIFAIRLFPYMLMKLDYVWVPIIAVVAFITMTAGNLMAIPQKNIKRLLAYSTISQAGYILVGFAGASVTGISSVLFYLLAFTFSNMAAFGVVIAFSKITGSDNIEDYAGLARRSPLLSLTFLLALLSLAGIPPLAGFVGKFYLFYAAMQKGFLLLVIAAALNSTISLYYYLLVLKQVYIKDSPKGAPKITLGFPVKIGLILTIAGILALGIMPAGVIDFTIAAAQKLFVPAF